MKQRNRFALLAILCGALLDVIPAQEVGKPTPAGVKPPEFQQIHRPGSVVLAKEYDLANLTIPEGDIHALLPRDAIPALTDPKLETAKDASWLGDDARVVVVTRGRDVVGIPLRILDWHEVVNLTVGGEPVAVTYCPLCDSAAVFSRVVEKKSRAGESRTSTLEFGVSGALYNSNVLMYDRQDRGLWSQVAMQAVSGPLAGTLLETWPVDIVRFAPFRAAHADAKIVSKDTGHNRDYGRSPYESYFGSERLMVPVRSMGTVLPRKTLGIGIATETRSWFVPAGAITASLDVETEAGVVTVVRDESRIAATKVPAGVRTLQTFYYAWSAFFPKTEVVQVPSPQAKLPGEELHR
jgi:hypothetical protein